MQDASGRYSIVLNGEVFNFIELRKELESLGHSFSTQTDSEVALAAIIEWGQEAFHRFNGMWAMAIWDSVERSLLLCRDRFGIKPLYYYRSEDRFAFASETKAFKRLEGFQRRVSRRLLRYAMEDTYFLEGQGYTIFEDILQLLPGHLLSIRDGEVGQQKRWYDIREEVHKVPVPYEEQVELFRELFSDACRLRMRSDVTMATALSGGVDSTAVYSMVHRLMKQDDVERVPEDWQRAFVASFPGTDKDERIWAERALKAHSGSGVFIEPSYADLPEQVLQSTLDFDGVSSAPIWALTDVYRAMHDHGVTVSLDGHGVDEMLYGYRWMVYDGMVHHIWKGTTEDAKRSIDVLIGLYPPELREEKRILFESDLESAIKTRRSTGFRLKQQMKSLFPRETRVNNPNLAPLSDKPYSFSNEGAMEEQVFDQFFLKTLPTLLHNFDFASMRSGIEIRMPFMDYRLVEYAFALPYSSKVGGGYTKRILRDGMKGIMPEENRTRTFKVGLGAPTKDWLAGPLNEWMGDMISSSSFQELSLSSAQDLTGMEKRHRSKTWSDADAAQDWLRLNAALLNLG
jgi:asparagine synthase (glutamine-hydrolysing)